MKKIIPILFLIILVAPLIVSAQAYPDPVQTICNVLQVIKNILLAIGLGIAVIGLIVGGIMVITAGGDSQKAENGKKAIINFAIGIVIVLAAAFILALVQGILVGTGISIFADPCAP